MKRGRKKLTREQRYQRLLSIGYNTREAKKFCSEKSYRSARDRKVRQNRKTGTNKIVVISYQDFVGDTDPLGLNDYLNISMKARPSETTKMVKEALDNQSNIGHLGRYHIEVIRNEQKVSWFTIEETKGFNPVWNGSGESFTNVNACCNVMMSLLYESWRRDMFVRDFIRALMNTENPKAIANAKKLKKIYID